MAGSMRAAVCALLGGLVGWCNCGTGMAQDVSARPEVVPAPAAITTPQQDGRGPVSGWLQPAQDPYRRAEQERAWAVSRQLQSPQTAWWYQVGPAPYYVPVPSVPPVYVYGPPRAIRRAYRYGYWAVPQPRPYVSVGVYPYPYSTWGGPPPSYGQIWIGPNSYVYRPYYGQPRGQQNVPTPAAPSVAPPERIPPGYAQPPGAVSPTAPPSGPLLNGPSPPTPEAIPAPPANPTPGAS
jgi:hypothetical protein